MNDWDNCPLCNGKVGKEVSSQAKSINHVFIIVTDCICGLSFVTNYSLADVNNEDEINNAWNKHRKKWNSRQYQKDMVDIGVYAQNILNRTQEYSQLKKEKNDD